MTHNSADLSGFAGFQSNVALGRLSKRMSSFAVAVGTDPCATCYDNGVSGVGPRKWKHEGEIEVGPRFVF